MAHDDSDCQLTEERLRRTMPTASTRLKRIRMMTSRTKCTSCVRAHASDRRRSERHRLQQLRQRPGNIEESGSQVGPVDKRTSQELDEIGDRSWTSDRTRCRSARTLGRAHTDLMAALDSLVPSDQGSPRVARRETKSWSTSNLGRVRGFRESKGQTRDAALDDPVSVDTLVKSCGKRGAPQICWKVLQLRSWTQSCRVLVCREEANKGAKGVSRFRGGGSGFDFWVARHAKHWNVRAEGRRQEQR